MNIKSLLLGSAAALVAVSGARAADVIVADPEPVEYVRVCDAYGTGFFYIPGTETCLRIGGYMQYDIGFGDLNGDMAYAGFPAGGAAFGPPAGPAAIASLNILNNETYRKRARFQFEVDAREETEYGTLRGFAALRFDYGNGAYPNISGLPGVPGAISTLLGADLGYDTGHGLSVNQMYIELGGLRIGKTDSFFSTFTGYAGSVINDTTGGGYGPFDTNLISYTYSNGPFSAGISFEEGEDAYLDVVQVLLNAVGGGAGDRANWGIDDYMPHVVAGLGYDAGIVNLRGVFAWDSRDNYIDALGNFNLSGGWSAKLRGDVDITSSISAFLMVMYGENSSAYTTWATGGAAMNTWSVIGGASIGLTPKATFNTQIQWAESNGGASDVWGVIGNVSYAMTDNFVVTPEVQWLHNRAGDNQWGGQIRFRRSF